MSVGEGFLRRASANSKAAVSLESPLSLDDESQTPATLERPCSLCAALAIQAAVTLAYTAG